MGAFSALLYIVLIGYVAFTLKTERGQSSAEIAEMIASKTTIQEKAVAWELLCPALVLAYCRENRLYNISPIITLKSAKAPLQQNDQGEQK